MKSGRLLPAIHLKNIRGDELQPCAAAGLLPRLTKGQTFDMMTVILRK
jgi:hypothetical protein